MEQNCSPVLLEIDGKAGSPNGFILFELGNRFCFYLESIFMAPVAIVLFIDFGTRMAITVLIRG